MQIAYLSQNCILKNNWIVGQMRRVFRLLPCNTQNGFSCPPVWLCFGVWSRGICTQLVLGKLAATGLWYQVWKEMGSVAILGQIWARNRTFLFGGQICNSVDNHFYCLILLLFRESNIAQLTGCPHPAECGVTMGLAVLKTYGMMSSEIGRLGKLL